MLRVQLAALAACHDKAWLVWSFVQRGCGCATRVLLFASMEPPQCALPQGWAMTQTWTLIRLDCSGLTILSVVTNPANQLATHVFSRGC